MLESLGWGEIGVLLVLALFVFGPERLPGMAAEAGKGLRKLRLYVKGMTDDLKTELGPELGEVDLRSLNPKTFIARNLLADDDEDEDPAGGRPRSRADTPLPPGEPAPWDPDTT
ncbi:Sec-independent protein translocase protein TatB [soil metagenome]